MRGSGARPREDCVAATMMFSLQAMQASFLPLHDSNVAARQCYLCLAQTALSGASNIMSKHPRAAQGGM